MELRYIRYFLNLNFVFGVGVCGFIPGCFVGYLWDVIVASVYVLNTFFSVLVERNLWEKKLSMLVIMLLFRKRGMECFELNFRWLIWLGGRLSNILTGSQSEPTASLLRDQFVGEALLRKEAYPLHKRS